MNSKGLSDTVRVAPAGTVLYLEIPHGQPAQALQSAVKACQHRLNRRLDTRIFTATSTTGDQVVAIRLLQVTVNGSPEDVPAPAPRGRKPKTKTGDPQ